jgi:hypothetical protein
MEEVDHQVPEGRNRPDDDDINNFGRAAMIKRKNGMLMRVAQRNFMILYEPSVVPLLEMILDLCK